jgi:hypothetical protein
MRTQILLDKINRRDFYLRHRRQTARFELSETAEGALGAAMMALAFIGLLLIL